MDWLWGPTTADVGTQCFESTETVGTQCLQSTRTVAVQCFQPSLESAARMMGEQKYDEAYGIVMEYAKVFELAKAFSLLAECAYELGRYDEVPDLVAASIVHLGPKQEHVLHLAGLAFLKMGRCEEAYLSLRRALKLRPTCPKIHGALKDIAEKMQAQSQETDVPYLWQYQEQDGSWSDMPLALCQELESAFAKSQANPQSAFVKMHGREFDFGTMRQRNIASGRWRSVRRQCVAAMVKASSIPAQVLHTCLSQTVASRQATAAAEDVRKELANQLDLLARQQPAMKPSEDLNTREAFLNQWQEELQIKEASVKELQKNLEVQEASMKEEETRLKLQVKAVRLREKSLEQRINEEVEIRMAELEAKHRNRAVKIAAADLGLDNPKGNLQSIIFGQRQEIEFWRSRDPCQERVLLHRLGCSQAMFLQDGTLVEPMQQLLLGTAEPHNKPFNGKVSICQQMSGVQVHRVLRVVNPALWRAYWGRKAKLREGRGSGRIQPLLKTKEMKHLETIAFEAAPDQKTLGATYWIYVDKHVNEMLLFHGTSASNAESIATAGFDLRRVRQGLYGNGFYFSCEACKSFQYTTLDTVQSERCIIVARVLLGNPKFATSSLSGPRILADNENSVVVLPQNVPGQEHHEFVVFDAGQIFPEFIVYFA